MDDPIALTSDLDQMARWVLSLPVDDLRIEFTIRSSYTLKMGGVNTIGDLVQRTPRDVLMMRVGGRKVLNEVQRVLAEMGLELTKETP